MKIPIIIALLALVLAEDPSIQPVVLDPVPSPTLPQPTPEAEKQIFEGLEVPTNPEIQQFEKAFDPLENNVIEEEERRQELIEEKQQSKKLLPWIALEMEALRNPTDLVTHEIFAFKIQKDYEFRWDPSKKGIFKIVFEVFNYENGDITLADKPDEDDNIQVLARADGSMTFVEIGKVYMKRIFDINFHSDYQVFRVVNNFDEDMLVQVSLELTNFVPEEGVKDDEFKMSSEKIKSILKQLEDTQVKREKVYKTQWSFRDREEQHQSEMLILTGLELLVILATAVVQIYCIKSLLDNRLIV